jgi:hypothetical protein
VNAPCVCEKGPSSFTAHEHEEEIARRWWALPLNVKLPLSNGDSCQLLYAGRPGGSLGPDVRDAVLRFTSHRATTTFAAISSQDAINTAGDVEIHIRASDWFAHQHHTDARYNNVMLHVVLICDDSRPTLRQDGTAIPTCSLYDLPRATNHPAQWPCHHVMASMNEEQRARLLTLAGIMRFEQKAHALLEALRDAQPSELFSACDVCLIPALAEGLGYGRDRAFFRAAGLHLIGVAQSIPEPLGRAPEPSPLDASRLHILHNLVEQWRTTGAWETLRKATANASPRRGDASVPSQPNPTPAPTRTSSAPTAISALRNIFAGLSKARADILICNIVLPFAVAVAQQENDAMLAEQARNLFIAYPGLPSNQITRAMCRQLLLQSEPKSACQQQGLHFIYAQTCREKRCIDCMLGKQGI